MAIRLTNDVLQLTISPELGGTGTSLIYQGQELIRAAEGQGGFLDDRLWYPERYDLSRQAYEVLQVEAGDPRTLHLWTRLEEGAFPPLELHKTITLAGDAPVVTVDYAITLNASETTDFLAGLWFHQRLGVAGEGNVYCVPLQGGTRKLTQDPAQGSHWHHDPVAGWSGVVGETSQVGLVCAMAPDHLDYLYNWLGAPNQETLEWYFLKLPLSPGVPFETSLTVQLFHGLQSVDTAFAGIVGEWELAATYDRLETIRPVLRLHSATPRQLTMEVQARQLRSETWETLLHRELELAPALTQAMAIPLTPPGWGEVAFRCRFLEAGEPIGVLERRAEWVESTTAPPPSNAYREALKNDDYLTIVTEYVDTLLVHGRDTYGDEHSPLIAAALERESLRLGSKASFGPIDGIREFDRSTGGANPQHDENLYQIMDALAVITGKPYDREANAILSWFFAHCQSPETGLMAWGEHLYWDFYADTAKGDETKHEFYRPWLYWEACWKSAPEAARAFAEGLWQHQIGDQTTGQFSRHARWARHGPSVGYDFPRHGGFFIHAWAYAYGKTADPLFLQAIETVLGLFCRTSSTASGMIPCQTAPAYKEDAWPQSNLSLAVDLWTSAAWVPAELANAMRARAAKTDRLFLALPHGVTGDGPGFVDGCHVHTMAPTAHTATWTTGYGHQTDAQMANLCKLRHDQLPEGATKAAYRQLIMDCATRYLSSEPDLTQTIYPGALGDAMLHLLDACELSGQPVYLERAKDIARIATDKFLDEHSALPKASSHHAHYEAITRADTMMMALLRLWVLTHRPDLDINLTITDR